MELDENWCQSCFADLPTGIQKYCSSACRQRAYRDRKRIAREKAESRNEAMEQADLIDVLTAVLSPQRIETYLPKARVHMRRILKRALKTL